MLTWTDVAGIAVVGFFLAMVVALLKRPAGAAAEQEPRPEECPTCGREFTVQAQIDWRPKPTTDR